MLSWLFARRRALAAPEGPPGSLAYFQSCVQACATELNELIPKRCAGRYSPAVVATALTLELEMAIRVALESDNLTAHEARALVMRLAKRYAPEQPSAN